MKHINIVILFFSFCLPVYAASEIIKKGNWPEDWPKELEPLRKQSRTVIGGLSQKTCYEIPFDERMEFEAAWPHILKVKSKGAPVILLRSPHKIIGQKIKAGVRVWYYPVEGKEPQPAKPIPGADNIRTRWMKTTYIDLIVDGDIVDLNRIPIPEETPIIDLRFKDGQ